MPPAIAQATDTIAAISTKRMALIATYKVANPDRNAIWLNGYFHGKRGDMIVNTRELDESTDKVKDYCIKNPEVLLTQAVETLFGSRKLTRDIV